MSRPDNGDPSLADGEGRNDADGRFTAGNRFSKGNPHSKAVNHFRSLILDAVSDADMNAVVLKLVKLAKAGEPWAVKEFFDRVVGKASQPLEVDADVDTAETRDMLVKWLKQEAA